MRTSKEMAALAVQALEDKKGLEIKVLEMEKVTVLADYFVICTASSTTHVKTLADAVEKLLEESGEQLLHREGYRSGGWVLLDYGAVVVHLFLEETREFYNLERLWADAKAVEL